MTVTIAKLSAFLIACILPHEASPFSVSSRLTPKRLMVHQPLQRRQHRSPPWSNINSIIHNSATNNNHMIDDDELSPNISEHEDDDDAQDHHQHHTRRSILQQGLLATTAMSSVFATTNSDNNVANAAIGTLPEFSDTNAILQSITIDVTDTSQYDETIAFFTKGFDGMKVLRERGSKGGGLAEKNTWLGFGPETLSIPSNFELPVSSLSQYGGHASIHIRYDPSTTAPYYKRSAGEYNNEPARGDNIAYLQIGVPQYRMSKLVENGGNILDAYGWVNVVSPAGLPVRGIIGIRADPIMFLALNCQDVGESEEFYAKLGFVRQEYPYARLNQGQGQFEPPQPSKSVYVAPSPNSMGILLLQNQKRKKKVVPNPVLRSLNVVYAPPENDGDDGDDGDGNNNNLDPQFVDPSSVPIAFISQDYLEKEIKMTAIPQSL
ncbi:hypothetical protein ACHAXR_003955 [Thalassiosira sp. AJA248-18]